MEWTCIQCNHKYDDNSGDTEERMCNDCLLSEEVAVLNKSGMIGEKEFFDLMKRANRDLNNHERWMIWIVTKRLLKEGNHDG